MRTTLTIDDDVLKAARALARAEGRSVGQVLSELARRGLRPPPRRRPRGGFPTFPVPCRRGTDHRWATCPTTESGFVRVSSNRAVIPHAFSPIEAIELLDEITQLDGHEFWPDDVRGVVGPSLDASLVVGHGQVTDTHLLSLAVSRGATLATLDRAVRR